MPEPEYRRIHREKAYKDKKEADRKTDESAKESYVKQIVSAINTVVERIDRQQNENTPEIKWEHKWRKGEVLGLWTAALTGIIAIIVSSIDASHQRTVMQEQLNEMQAGQRPWITIDLKPGALQRAIQINGKPSYFGGIPFQISLLNVGHSPAFNVNTALFGFVDGPGRDVLAEQKRSCDGLASAPLDNPARGIVLFPGQVPVPLNMGMSPGAGFTDPEVRKYGAIENGHMTVDLWVIGCVDYLFGEPQKHHQTGFVYRIGYQTARPDGLKSLTFEIPVDIPVPAESILLFQSPSSSVRTD